MEVFGYKAFNKDLTNRYGVKFSVGNSYTMTKDEGYKYGRDIKNTGYHMCKNIEDTFRYFDAMNDEIKICYCIGSGEVVELPDEYYGYYDKFVVSHLEIVRLLSHEEIINIGLSLNDLRAKIFVSGFRLTKEEIKQFENKFSSYNSVLYAIEYYQKGNTKVYEEGVKKYGQYSNKRS